LEENNTESANHNSKFQMRQQHWAVNEDVYVMFFHYGNS
jgi:hypothetical protein